VPPTADDLERVRALAARDAELSVETESIDRLTRQTSELRARASELLGVLAALPEERATLEASSAQAARRVEEAAVALAQARAELESAAGARRDREQRLAEARADEAAASQAVDDGRRNVARIAEKLDELDGRRAELERERGALGDRATALAREVRGTHRVAGTDLATVPADLADLDTWGVKARAALLVAGGSVANERERLLAEASVVGAAALGEDVLGVSVALLLVRMEKAHG
jgi:chromosome segregation ATPase